MDKNLIYNQIPFNIYSTKYNNKRNKINMKKNIFAYYNYANEGKISLIKNIQINKKEYFPHQLKKNIINMNRTNNKSLTQKKQSNINNDFFHINNNNNSYFRQEKHYKSLINQKNDRFLSSENMSSDFPNPAMTVLINNGVIKNMYLNKNEVINNNPILNYTYNINNNIHKNIYNYPLSGQKTNNNKNLYTRKTNDIIYNLTQPDFENENNINNLSSGVIKNYKYKNFPTEYDEIKQGKSIENIIINRKNNQSTNNVKNINFNQNFFNHKSKITNKPINQKINNNKKITRHFYSKTNDNIEDISFLPLPVQYMKKISFPTKAKQQLIVTKENKNNDNNQEYNKMKSNKSFNKLIETKPKTKTNKTNKTNDLISSSSSSDELSLLATEIVNRVQRDKLIKRKIYSDKKSYINSNRFAKILQKNKIENINLNQNLNISDNTNTKKKKLNSLIIPININNFKIYGKNNLIKINDYKNKPLNTNNNTNKDIKDIDKNKTSFSGITLNNYQLTHDNKNKKLENNNKNDITDNNNNKSNNNNNKANIIEIKNEIKNIDVKKNEDNNIIKNETKEENMKNNESTEECFSLIEQIMKQTEEEEKNKKDRHINFNLDNNIYIYYKKKDLITKKVIYKGNEKINTNNNDEKKMDIYFELLKSKNKYNSIIKNYDKNEIKVNKDYELNEDMEEYEMLGDLYNIFFYKDINDLDKKLKKTIDKFMKGKNI